MGEGFSRMQTLAFLSHPICYRAKLKQELGRSALTRLLRKNYGGKMQEANIAGNGAKPPVARRNGSGDTEQARPTRVADPTAVSQPVTRGATGPRTKRGKAISSKNGLKHGFLSGEVVIRSKNWSESRSQFNKLVRGDMDHY